MEHIYITTTKRNPKGKCIYFIRQRHTQRTSQVIKETKNVSRMAKLPLAFEDPLQSYGWIAVKVGFSFWSFVFWIL
jgi:hypothetical protein